MNLGFNELIKMTEPFLWVKFLLCPIYINWAFLDPNLTFLNVSLNLCINISLINHGAEMSMIWLVERSAIKLLILHVTKEK